MRSSPDARERGSRQTFAVVRTVTLLAPYPTGLHARWSATA